MDAIDKPRPKNYKPGTSTDRYARFLEDWVAVTRTDVLNQLAEALDQHQQVLAIGANGVGKSYGAGGLGVAALYCNPHTVVPITAGTGGTLEDNIWKPIKSLWKNSELPGRYLDNKRELRTEFDDEWYLKCVSPKYPDDLEGDHNENLIYIIEEADKPGVTYEHIDSVRSTVTDESDRILVIANPPEDESNSVSQLIESDEWHTLQFSSWDSHNVKVETGEIDGQQIGGLATLQKIKDDWKEYHDEPWPGLEQVKAWSDPDSQEFRSDLHTKWYKRRAGIVPPQGAEKWRPFTIADVEAAYNRPVDPSELPNTFAVDVARSGDKTVGTAKYGREIRVEYARQGTNHVQQKKELRDIIYGLNSPQLAVDAVGEGSGLADELNETFASVTRFSNGMKPNQETDYYDAWAEALAAFGEFLDSGGSFSDKHLYEEAKVAARVIEFSTKSLASRNGEVIEATEKAEIKERLGHSPDYLDSALMCNWLDTVQPQTKIIRKSGKATKSDNYS